MRDFGRRSAFSQVGAAYAPMRPGWRPLSRTPRLGAALRPKHRHRRTREKADGRDGPTSTIYITCVVGACAVLAVLALPMIIPPAKPSPPRSDAPKPWDAESGGAQAGLDNISRGTHAAGAARLTPDPVAAVRDGSMRYTAERLAEIRDEIATIDANQSPAAADVERRRALVEEQQRLLRY
jgi:hypothetical protein